jgi:hypothetical protein
MLARPQLVTPEDVRRPGSSRSLGDPGGELGDCGRLEQSLQRKVRIESLLDFRE